jgi:2-C-methyl-D-erythritol 4-phosphate cytidylyltransferase
MAGRTSQSHRAVALILAAGAGQRLGGSGPKAFAPLGGRPLIWLSIEAASLALVDAIVVVMPAGYGGDLDRLAGVLGGSVPRHIPIRTAVGGATRQESVRLGLEAVAIESNVVVVHDAARPFASSELFDRGIEALRLRTWGPEEIAGAIPILPCPDTVKRVRDGLVVETVQRDELALAQTPQAFLAAALRDAHASARAQGLTGTDDAMLLEAAGYRVMTFPGEAGNFKITTPEDLARAERDLSARARSG